MEYLLDPAINAFVTLFVIIDPIGLAPLFLALTQGMDKRERRIIALRGTAVAAGILVLFALAGEAVLAFVGISMPAFRIAGGLLLFLTALDMLFERRTERREKQTGIAAGDPSVFPLAIPLLAGPGAIASVILLMDEHEGDIAGQGMVVSVLVSVLLMVLIAMLLAPLLERALGKTGVNVVTRLLGMLLAALSVQFVLDGLAGAGLMPGG